MNRVIEITGCKSCPHFKQDVGLPYCKASGIVPFPVIPYVNENGKYTPKEIPDFCPLETAEDFAENNFDIDRKF